MATQTTKTKYQEKFRLKKGDEVTILTGADKGKSGKIEKVDYKKLAVVVSNLNIRKKHTKAGANGEQGGIFDVAAPIHISNVTLAGTKRSKKKTK